jgi:hypothetical protein
MARVVDSFAAVTQEFWMTMRASAISLLAEESHCHDHPKKRCPTCFEALPSIKNVKDAAANFRKYKALVHFDTRLGHTQPSNLLR